MADSNKQVINTLEMVIITNRRGTIAYASPPCDNSGLSPLYKHICPQAVFPFVDYQGLHTSLIINNYSCLCNNDSSNSLRSQNPFLCFFFFFCHSHICHPLLIAPIICLLLTHLSLLQHGRGDITRAKWDS